MSDTPDVLDAIDRAIERGDERRIGQPRFLDRDDAEFDSVTDLHAAGQSRAFDYKESQVIYVHTKY